MKPYSALFLASILGLMVSVSAQDAVVGKYIGTMERTTQMGKIELQTVRLMIDTVEGGAVQGTVTYSGRWCNGDYPVVGTLDGDKLTLRLRSKEGVRPDCGVNFELTVKGNKLEGKTHSGFGLRFSK